MSNPLVEKFSKSISAIQEKNPYLIVCGIVFGVLVIDYFAVLQFQLAALTSLTPKINALSQETKETTDNAARMPQYEREVKSLSEKIEKISQKVKPKGEMPLIIENISRIANKSGVKIDQIMPDQSAEKQVLKNKQGVYYSIPILVEARSGYHQFGHFFNQLEVEGIFMDIPEFSIMGNASEPMQHKIKLTLKVIFLENAK